MKESIESGIKTGVQVVATIATITVGITLLTLPKKIVGIFGKKKKTGIVTIKVEEDEVKAE